MSPPFMSDYKKWFILKRLCQTFVGGPRLICPVVYLIIQIILFILPAIIFSIVNITTYNLVSISWKSFTVGLVIFLLDTVLSFILFILKKDKFHIRPRSSNGSTFFCEEDYVIYEGLFSPSTWHFVAPNATLTLQHFTCVAASSVSFFFCTPIIMNEVISPILQGFALFTLCNARYSSVLSTPPEVVNFNPIKLGHPIYRPFYTAILGFTYFLCSISFSIDHILVNIFIFVLDLLPVIWVVGILPPLNALASWSVETVLRLLGGSPTYYYGGSLIGLILTLVASVLVFISGQQSLVLTTLLQCTFGYLINLDIGKIAKLNRSKGQNQSSSKGLYDPLLTFGFSLVTTSLTTTYIPEISDHALYIGIALTLMLMIELLTLICSMPNRKIASYASIVHLILQKILVGFLTVWITIEVASIEKSRSGVQSLHYLITYALGIRGYGRILTFTRLSAIDIGLATIFTYYIGEFFNQLEFTTSLLIVSIASEKLVRSIKYFNMMRLVLQADLVSQLLENPYYTAAITLVCLPISFISVVLTILINGTILYPLFTLPVFFISFPRPSSFWKTKWLRRKTKQNEKGNNNLDYIMYKQIGPELAKAFLRRLSGSGEQCQHGSCYIGRYEDRLIFMRIITVGWNYLYIQIKGLEMQEQTSCHHQEAAWIDEVFDKVLDSRSKFCSLSIRKLKYVPSILTPMTTLKIPTYSESKSTINNLTSLSEKKTFEELFFKSFSYLWIKLNPIFKGEAYKRSVNNSSYGLHSTPNYVPDFDSGTDEDGLMHKTKHNIHTNIIEAGITPVIPRYTIPPYWLEGNDPYNPNHGDSKDRFLTRLSSARPSHGLKTEFDYETSDEPWIKKLVGQTIPSNAVNIRIRKLVSRILQIVLGEAREHLALRVADATDSDTEEDASYCCEDFYSFSIVIPKDYLDIDLHDFFKENFLMNDSASLAIKKLDKTNILDITKKAFKYASKLTLDTLFSSIILMEENEVSLPSPDETFDQLSLYDRDYIFCTFNQIPYYVENKQKHIITISKNEQSISQLRIFNYEGSGVGFRIGKLNDKIVEGIWGNLNVELLYLTSDDDERFSIQHDRHLLRNILTQCANTPLGYPVYDEVYRLSLLNNFEPELIE